MDTTHDTDSSSDDANQAPEQPTIVTHDLPHGHSHAPRLGGPAHGHIGGGSTHVGARHI